MTVIAIVGAGAGTGLGSAVARRFGAQGFAVALISRNQNKLDLLADALASEGVTARGYAASVRDPRALASALEQAAQDLSPDVLAERLWEQHIRRDTFRVYAEALPDAQ